MERAAVVGRQESFRDITTRDLSNDFSRMVFETILGETVGGVCSRLLMSALVPFEQATFDWEKAELRADWELRHGHFVDFANVKDLLSDLHT